MADSNVLMPPDYLHELFATWQRRHRARVLAGDRQSSGGHLGRARMRVPQHLSGALAVLCRRRSASASRRARPCCTGATIIEAAGGIRALGCGTRGGCGVDQDRPPAGPARARRRPPFAQPLGRRTRRARCGSGRSAGRGCGATPSCSFFLPEFSPGALPPLAACDGSRRRERLAAVARTAGVRRALVRRRSVACRRGRLALVLAFAARLDDARRCCRCCGARAGWAMASSGATTPCASPTVDPA